VQNRDIIHRLVRDIVDNSNVANEGEAPCIAVSSAVHGALNELAEFSRKRIYECDTVRAFFGQIRKAIESLYQEIKRRIESARRQDDAKLFAEELLSAPHDHRNSCLYVLREFLVCEVREWREEAAGRLALDFVAGMTDNFLISAFEELFLPRSIV
jgi:dGTP triphosphohydrolase